MAVKIKKCPSPDEITKKDEKNLQQVLEKLAHDINAGIVEGNMNQLIVYFESSKINNKEVADLAVREIRKAGYDCKYQNSSSRFTYANIYHQFYIEVPKKVLKKASELNRKMLDEATEVSGTIPSALPEGSGTVEDHVKSMPFKEKMYIFFQSIIESIKVFYKDVKETW